MRTETKDVTVLALPDALRERLSRCARAGYPREACGVLIGRRDGGRTKVLRVEEGRNLDAERCDRYELDPADLKRFDDLAREAGLDLVGIWHSHPDHPARPSRTDLERAWEGWCYVITSVTAAGIADVRSWRLSNGTFQEQEIQPWLEAG